VKSLQFEPQLNVRYRGLLAEYLKASFATRQLANNYGSFTGALEQVMTAGILILGAYLVMNGSAMTIGMLVAFQMFAGRVSQPMMRLVGLWQQWQQTRISVARLGDIMNAPAESYSLKPRRAAGNGPGVVDVEGLSFRFADNLPMLYEDFDLKLPAGQVIALTGPSGAGKSTLAKLLQGFYVPRSGRIRIDGVDIQALSANELRSVFGVVPQETVLFSGTLRTISSSAIPSLRSSRWWPHAEWRKFIPPSRRCRRVMKRKWVSVVSASLAVNVNGWLLLARY
jgi:subfamily B ATP-binding cassette protein HlyB/CyaB